MTHSDGKETWRSTRRWFPRYDNLGTPGRQPVEPMKSTEWFELEKQRLWPKVWLKVARVEEFANPGDYLMRDIPPCDTSILIVRGSDNVFRAFHNVCTHRGSMLCWEKDGEFGSTNMFKCPYHGFTFDLSGRLRWVPEERNFYDFHKEDHGLKSVVLDIWEGFIFVHIAPDPRETLREYLGEVGERLTGHPFHEAPHYYEYKAEVHCNWKIMIAGFLENYHTATLHAGAASIFTTKDNPFSRNLLIDLQQRHRLISIFGNPEAPATPVGAVAFSHGAPLMQASATDGVPGAVNPTNSTHWSFDINNIFPNFQLNVVNGAWYTHSFWPTAPDKVRWESRMYFARPSKASERFFQEYSKVVTRDVLMEDGILSERIQHVLHSGAIDNWLVQDEEIAVQHFNKVVADYVSGAMEGRRD